MEMNLFYLFVLMLISLGACLQTPLGLTRFQINEAVR